MTPGNPTIGGTGRRRPALVWLVSPVLVLLAAYAPYAYYLLATDAVDPSANARLSLLVEAPLLFYTFSGATALLNLACGVTLFALRKIAVRLFGAHFVLFVAANAARALVPSAPWVDWSNPVAVAARIIGVVVSVGIFGGLWAYAWRLSRRGLLS